ncbi:GTPase-activating protein skywalker, partial [Pseudolycoriella hygida]
MPSNGDTSANADKLSGIEEESDIYEAFPPHVDTTQITVLSDSPADAEYSKTKTLIVKYTQIFGDLDS